MIYFYVGIGFVMFGTVVSLFQTSTSITNSYYNNESKFIDSNKVSIQKQNDKLFLSLLSDLNDTSMDPQRSICSNIKNGFTNQNDPNHPILFNYLMLDSYNIGINSNSTHSKLSNGCNLVNGQHRVLIVPNLYNNNYNLYSCIIGVNPKCNFELTD